MGKYKIKTKKTAAKRFKLRKSGKITRNHSNFSHNTGLKSSKHKRRLRAKGLVPASLVKKIKRMLNKA